MDTPSSLMAVVTTVGSQEQARILAQQMVEAGLAACAQISEIESFYVWKGQMQQEAEWRVVLKTTTPGLYALKEALGRAHPYEVPAILSLRVDDANAAFAQWVGEQVQG